MPISASPSTSRRLLALLSLLQARRDWPAHVLAERLEVSERTVRRDIGRLRELDYTIDATPGPDGGYRLGAGARLPPLLFDDDQVVALTVALRSVATLGAGLEEAADRALGTVSRLLPTRLSHRIESLAVGAVGVPGAAPATVDPAVLLRIGDAIQAGEEVRFDYAAPGSVDAEEAPVRVVEPHHLLVSGGRWYLIGFSRERDDWRVHRVDRMALRSHTGRRFPRRTVPGGDPAAFLAARFRGAPGSDTWPCWGEATVHAPLGDVAPYVGDGSAESLAADRCRVRLGSWSWDGVAAAFARFAVPIDGAHPAELRSAFATLGERARAAALGTPAESDR